jgi:hypothetical protein
LAADDPLVRDMASNRTVSCGEPRVICQSSTAYAPKRMIVSLNCGPTGFLYWYVFAQISDGSWHLAQKPSDIFEGIAQGDLEVSRKHQNDLILRQPIYLSDDPECCPAGGSTDQLLRWEHDQYVVVHSVIHEPEECARGIRRSEFEMFSNPYKTKGRCYQLLAHVVQWLGPNAALMNIDFSGSSRFSVMVDFPNSPDKSILQLVAVGEGAYTYANTLGALITVPGVRVVQITRQGAF